jgi:hypothetical protein
MVDKGARADEKQQAEIVAYLVRNFGPGCKVQMNTAPTNELTVVLGFTADESKALVAYRTYHGGFRTGAKWPKFPEWAPRSWKRKRTSWRFERPKHRSVEKPQEHSAASRFTAETLRRWAKGRQDDHHRGTE